MQLILIIHPMTFFSSPLPPTDMGADAKDGDNDMGVSGGGGGGGDKVDFVVHSDGIDDGEEEEELEIVTLR